MNKHTPLDAYIRAVYSAEQALAAKERAGRNMENEKVLLELLKDECMKKYPKGKLSEKKRRMSHLLLLITGKDVESQYEIRGGRPVPA